MLTNCRIDPSFSVTPNSSSVVSTAILLRPVCAVFKDFITGQEWRLRRGEFGAAPPFSTGPDTLFVAYYASAEIGFFRALNWPTPARILDLFTEFRNLTNGLPRRRQRTDQRLGIFRPRYDRRDLQEGHDRFDPHRRTVDGGGVAGNPGLLRRRRLRAGAIVAGNAALYRSPARAATVVAIWATRREWKITAFPSTPPDFSREEPLDRHPRRLDCRDRCGLSVCTMDAHLGRSALKLFWSAKHPVATS